jgi:N-acetylglucosaminyl-diphospho-decaprenol L-rhamnosyltransferase
MTSIDVVVVSYNSRDHLRRCVEPLCGREDVRVFVVDNASPEGSLDAVAGLPVVPLQLQRNGGFAHGCNRGWRAGRAPFVLFLNPDASIDPDSLLTLVRVLEQNPGVGAVGPRILDADGVLDYSQRRFPRLRSTYARALFLHRLLPQASWTDELVRDEAAYETPSSPQWISGACLLVRRSELEDLDGWDEQFFLYCEDKDLCRRLRARGFDVRYEPAAVCTHHGGASAPGASLLHVLAASRIRYARKHRSRAAAALERLGLVIEAVIRLAIARGGAPARAGHARALRTLAS